MEGSFKVLVVVSLLSAGLKLASSQAGGGSCFNNTEDYSCSGSFNDAGNRDECCLGAGFSFQATGSLECEPCTVFGWFVDELAEIESQDAYEPQVGYTKLPPETAPTTVSVIPELILDGSAEASDITFTEATLTIRSVEGTTQVTFVVDSIGMEPTETATLRLNVTAGSLLPNTVFARDLRLVITDANIVQITLSAREYGVNEGELEIEFTINKDIGIATPIEITIKPLSFEQYLAIEESERPQLEAGTTLPEPTPLTPNRATPVADYSPSTIISRFEADIGEIVFSRTESIPLVDDPIDENGQPGEYFIIALNVTQALNLDRLDLSGIQASLARIFDNDALRIGFEFAEYRVDEPDGEIIYNKIRLVKNIETEQTYFIAIANNDFGNNAATGGVNPIFVDPPANTTDIRDYEGFSGTFLPMIAPNEQSIVLPITLFSDTSPEGDEQFQLTASPSNLLGPQFNVPLPSDSIFSSTVVTIVDDESVVLAWERNLTLVEGEVSDEACYSIVPPDIDLPEDFELFVYVDTMDISANASSDYDMISSANFDQERLLTNTNRRACITVNANTDSVYEPPEVYQLNLVPDSSNVVVLNTAQVTINTTVVEIGFINPPYSTREDMGPMVFTIGVTNGVTLDAPIEFFFNTADIGVGSGLATAEVDYEITVQTLTFGPGIMQAIVNVPIFNDGNFEGDEVFLGQLFGDLPPGVTFSVPEADATIIDDEENVCMELGPLENGEITYNTMVIDGDSYLEGTVATHVCNDGFILQGAEIRTCRNDTFFDMEAPICVHTPTTEPPLPFCDEIGGGDEEETTGTTKGTTKGRGRTRGTSRGSTRTRMRGRRGKRSRKPETDVPCIPRPVVFCDEIIPEEEESATTRGTTKGTSRTRGTTRTRRRGRRGKRSARTRANAGCVPRPVICDEPFPEEEESATTRGTTRGTSRTRGTTRTRRRGRRGKRSARTRANACGFSDSTKSTKGTKRTRMRSRARGR